MIAWGVVFMIAGAVCFVLGVGGGLVGVALLGSVGGALFSLGIVLVIAGNIVAAIDRNGAAILAEVKGARDDHRKSFESNWQMFDRIRENTAAPAAAGSIEPASKATL